MPSDQDLPKKNQEEQAAQAFKDQPPLQPPQPEITTTQEDQLSQAGGHKGLSELADIGNHEVVDPASTNIQDRRSPFDVSGGIDHKLVEAYGPTVRGNGGEKIVYDLRGHPSSSFNYDQFFLLHPGLKKAFDWAKSKPQLKDSLKDFVKNAMHYSKQTEKAFDLFGPKNILFFENTDNSWNYKLVDALPPSDQRNALARRKELMEKVIANEPLTNDERFLLACAVNYARTLNGLAKHLGIKDHIDIMPPGRTVTPSEFWDLLVKWGPPQQAA